MVNNSFYGGRPGQSFSISQTFANKVELIDDLKAGFVSEIGYNEFVLIDYTQRPKSDLTKSVNAILQEFRAAGGAIPDEIKIDFGNDNEFSIKFLENNRKQINLVRNKYLDINTFNDTYNYTMWYKVYDESVISTKSSTNPNYDDTIATSTDGDKNVPRKSGIIYRKIATFTSGLPTISTKFNEVDPKGKSGIEINNENLNYPIITFNLKRGSQIHNALIVKTDEYVIPEYMGIGDLVINRSDSKIYEIVLTKEGVKQLEYITTFRLKVKDTFTVSNWPEEHTIETDLLNQLSRYNDLGEDEKICANYQLANGKVISYDAFPYTDDMGNRQWVLQRITAQAADWAFQANSDTTYEELLAAYNLNKIISYKEAEVQLIDQSFTFLGLMEEENDGEIVVKAVKYVCTPDGWLEPTALNIQGEKCFKYGTEIPENIKEGEMFIKVKPITSIT